jgi:hypothetical protein
MTQRDSLECVHEPFGDAFYFGPERLSDRYEDDDEARNSSGFSETTYKHVLEQIDAAGAKVQSSHFCSQKGVANYSFIS